MKGIAVFALALFLVVSAFGQDGLAIYPNGNVRALGRFLYQTGLVMPQEAILPYAGSVAPEGWLQYDGTQVSRTTFADHFSILETAFGPGDGSGTFHLPDLRGMFLRGSYGNAERNPGDSERTALIAGGAQGDSVGSYQADSFQGHWHQLRGDQDLILTIGKEPGIAMGTQGVL